MVATPPIQNLTDKVPIVDEGGKPTNFFIRLFQRHGQTLDDKVSVTEATAIADAEVTAGLTSHFITAGTALDGGGTLISNPTIDHADTAVTPGTYGDSTNVAQITVDQQGHITDVAEVPITGGGGGGTVITQDLTGLASYDFTSIPGTFSTLRLILNGGTTAATLQANPNITINGLTTGIYSTQRNYIFGTSGVADEENGATGLKNLLAGIPGTSAPSNSAGFIDLEIYDYVNTSFFKVGAFRGRQARSGSTQQMYYMIGNFAIADTGAVTSIKIENDGAVNFSNGSTATLILT